jgi:hypothetical protein
MFRRGVLMKRFTAKVYVAQQADREEKEHARTTFQS